MTARPLPLLFALALAGCAHAAAPARPGDGEVDYACRTDADCAVKNVGNCCGYYPACVNQGSPTYPEQVMEQCQREGRMSICGFREIAGCVCTEGRCEAKPGATEGNLR